MPAPRRISVVAAILLGAATALAAACSSPAPAPPPGDVQAYTNFTLIDGTDRAPVAGAAMLVDAGRITWIGRAADLKAPAGVQPTDLGGAHVIPGLINTHGHVGNVRDLTQDEKFQTAENVEQQLTTYARYGVTSVLSMGTEKDLVFPIRDAQRAGRPTFARLFTAGQGLVYTGGYGGVPGVNTPIAAVKDVDAAVEAQAAKHVDFVKLWLDSELGTMPKMPAAITQAIIESAHKRGLRVLAHIFYLADAKRLADQGVDGFVHSVRDRPIDQAFIDSMKAHGTWQAAATLSREASMFAYGSTPAFASDPFFTAGVSAAALDLIKSPERQKTIASNPNYRKYPAFFETAKQNFKKLVDAGVPYAMGTDSGPPGRFSGYAEHWELQLMVEAGITPAQAIRAATGRAAEFLGARDLGTLETGKWADFVVLDADPLADILNTRKIRSVYLAGRSTPDIVTSGR
jgi:imidazolonepropionase-like amidohydrolase